MTRIHIYIYIVAAAAAAAVVVVVVVVNSWLHVIFSWSTDGAVTC